MTAVLFDFFGTLTDPSAESLRRTAFDATAGALGVPAADFYAAMSRSFPERIVGSYGDTRATLATIARACGAAPTAAELDRAVEVQHDGAALVRVPRPGALATLDELRARGSRIGLISDCSSELCEAWPRTPFASRVDAPVFSWRERCRKPDPRLYATAASRLGVAPGECWYVGDGGSREHRGARAAGMRPVLVTNAGYPGAHAHRFDPDDYVPDLAVDDLTDLLDLIV
jgi:putative hydrolase of the HAD superfamily